MLKQPFGHWPNRNVAMGLLSFLSFISFISFMLGATSVFGAQAEIDEAKPSHEYSLDELIELARRLSPGLAANGKATTAVRAQVKEAKRNWLPTGELSSILTVSPKINCSPSEKECTFTEDPFPKLDTVIQFHGVFTRTQLTFVQPVYTFGKITAGIEAAEAGVEASASREQGLSSELELNIRKAYYGFKLARDIEVTLKEGLGYIQQAENMVQKDLDEGGGNMTITDKLRLQSTRAEVETQMLEVGRGEQIARAGIKALIGPQAPHDLAIDKAEIEKLNVTVRPLSFYEEQARHSRPEIRALDFLMRSKHKLADLEWAKQYPDLALVGTATYAYASAVDTPRNAFANNPFNTHGVGIAAAIRMPIDFGQRNARAQKALAEAEEAALRRQEAIGGIGFEVSKAYIEVMEANSRIETLAKGEKLSRRWLTAIVQKMDLGLAETREVTDALKSYFTMRVRYLQAISDFNIATAALTRATGSKVEN